MKKYLLLFSILLYFFAVKGQEIYVKYNLKIEVIPSDQTAFVTLNKLENVDSLFLGILTEDSYTEEEGDYFGISLYKLENVAGTQKVILSEVLQTDGIDSLYTLHPIVYFNNRILDPGKLSSSYGEGPAEVYPLCFTEEMLADFKRKSFTIKARR